MVGQKNSKVPMSMLPKQREGLSLQPVGDELLVLDLQADTIHQLNTTAGWIFEQCDGHTSVETLVDELEGAYGLDRQRIEADVRDTLAQLRNLRLIDYSDNDSNLGG